MAFICPKVFTPEIGEAIRFGDPEDRSTFVAGHDRCIVNRRGMRRRTTRSGGDVVEGILERRREDPSISGLAPLDDVARTEISYG